VKCKVGGLVVRLVAVALETGRKGDFIQVKNRSSKKIIQVKLDSSKHATYSTEG
jgi:flagella basal body P-ring formation protein FlgA